MENQWNFADIRQMLAERGQHAGELETVLVNEDGEWKVPQEEPKEKKPKAIGKYLIAASANIAGGAVAMGVANVISGWLTIGVVIPCLAAICILEGAA